MFSVSGISLCWSDAVIARDTVVAVAVRHLGFWSLNFCRIVYVIDETDLISRYGFAYGTLREHLERGEERFVVEWDHTTDLVWYDISPSPDRARG